MGGANQRLCPKMNQVTLEIKKGVTGVYVGQIKEIPGIIVQSKTVEGLEAEAKDSLDFYFETYPAEYDKLFETERIIQYRTMQVMMQ